MIQILNLLLALYGAFIFYLIFSLFFEKKRDNAIKKSDINGVSIIVPFRNEAENLANFIKSTQKLKCNFDIELLLVNDNSSDNYQEIIDSISDNNIKIRVINSEKNSSVKLSGKQNALDTGVKNAKYQWLAFTDADVTVSPDWLILLLNSVSNQRSIAFGHTTTVENKNLLQKYQAFQLDFLFSTAFAYNRANLSGSCMGNNLLVSKMLYSEIGGQEKIGYTVTEDLQLIKKAISIGAIINSTSPFTPSVYTKTPNTIAGFFNQSARWIRGGAQSNFTMFLVIALTAFQIMAPALFFITKNSNLLIIIVSNFFLQWIFSAIAFKKISAKSSSVFFPIYYLTMSITSILMTIPLLIFTPKWKERKL